MSFSVIPHPKRHLKCHPTSSKTSSASSKPSSNVIQNVIPTSSNVIQNVIPTSSKTSSKMSSNVIQNVIQRHPKRHPNVIQLHPASSNVILPSSKTSSNGIRHAKHHPSSVINIIADFLIFNLFAIQRYIIGDIQNQMTIQLTTYVIVKKSSKGLQKVLMPGQVDDVILG